jgi:hypothetical protein
LGSGFWFRPTVNARAITLLLEEHLGRGDLNMAEIAKGMLFISACASLYGLAAFLFRDQIKSRR